MDSVDKVKDLEQKLKASTLLAPTPTAYEPTSSSIIPKGKPTTEKAYKVSVSYTHLTLPTSDLV